jgi:hypothetical protein
MFVVVSLVGVVSRDQDARRVSLPEVAGRLAAARALIPHCFLRYEEVLSPRFFRRRNGANGSGVVKVF